MHSRSRADSAVVFNAELQAKYGVDGVSEEVAKQEAQKALLPFKLDFVKVDWHTLVRYQPLRRADGTSMASASARRRRSERAASCSPATARTRIRQARRKV